MRELTDIEIIGCVAQRLDGKPWAAIEKEVLPGFSGRGNNLRRAVYKKLFPRTRRGA